VRAPGEEEEGGYSLLAGGTLPLSRWGGKKKIRNEQNRENVKRQLEKRKSLIAIEKKSVSSKKRYSYGTLEGIAKGNPDGGIEKKRTRLERNFLIPGKKAQTSSTKGQNVLKKERSACIGEAQKFFRNRPIERGGKGEGRASNSAIRGLIHITRLFKYNKVGNGGRPGRGHGRELPGNRP